LRKSRGSAIGNLVRSLRKYYVDNPEDEFEVEFGGERITVKRQEIEET
jgi:hypothetical protein